MIADVVAVTTTVDVVLLLLVALLTFNAVFVDVTMTLFDAALDTMFDAVFDDVAIDVPVNAVVAVALLMLFNAASDANAVPSLLLFCAATTVSILSFVVDPVLPLPLCLCLCFY